MLRVKNWMYPQYYTKGNELYITFLTANGRKHDIKCKPNDKLQCYTFRFRNSTWQGAKYCDLLCR